MGTCCNVLDLWNVMTVFVFLDCTDTSWIYFDFLNYFRYERSREIKKLHKMTQDEMFGATAVSLLFPVFSPCLQLFPLQVSKQWEKLLAKEISSSIQISTRLVWSHLITIPPLEAIHPWLDYQPYFRIKYESNIENTI